MCLLSAVGDLKWSLVPFADRNILVILKMHVIGVKRLLHNEAKTSFYQNQARTHHNTTYSKQKVGLYIEIQCSLSTVVPLRTAAHIGWPSEAWFSQLTGNISNLSLAINDSLALSRNESHHHYCCVRNFFSFVFIASCIKQKWIAASWNENFPFCRMQPGFDLLVFLELVFCSLLVLATIMAEDPAPKREWRAIGTVCEACGKHFHTSDGFDKHRTSGYLVGTPCHVFDDGSTRAQLVATSRQIMSTAMLQKLKLARRTHGTIS